MYNCVCVLKLLVASSLTVSLLNLREVFSLMFPGVPCHSCPQTLNAITPGLNWKWNHQRCMRLYWGLQGGMTVSQWMRVAEQKLMPDEGYLPGPSSIYKHQIRLRETRVDIHRILMWSSSTHTSQLHVICKNLDIWNFKRSPTIRIFQSKKTSR